MQKVILKAFLLSTVVFATSSVASAQSTPGQQSGTQTAAAPVLEEVIVTGQKISQSLQKAPAAISVVSTADLVRQGVTDVRAVQFMVPTVRFNKQQSIAQLFIRGVGIASDAMSLDMGVAMTFNGIEQFREATGSSLFDIERVEVLKGPQATTYGSNAAGGVVNVVLAKPTHDYSGKAIAEFGNYDRKYLSAAQNAPIGDKASLRAAIDVQSHNGFAHNGLDDQKTVAGRLTFAAEMTDNFNALLWGNIYHAGGLGDVGYASPFKNPQNPWKQTWDRTALVTFNPNQIAHGRDVNIYEVGAELDWQFNGFKLTYLPGYISSHHQGHLVLDTGAARVLFEEINSRQQQTHELRLGNSESNDRFKWMLGGYYYDLDSAADRTVAVNHSFNIPKQSNKSRAGYGQVTYSLTDSLRVTGGGRYTYTKKSADGFLYTPGPAGTPIPFTASYSWNHVDWKVGAEYDLSPNSLLYATVQTGYLGGGINLFNSATQSKEVKPEKLVAYQAGVKNTLLDGTMRFNVEGYYYDWSNYQVGIFNVAAASNIIFNVPKSRVYGGEFDLEYAFTNHDHLTFNGGYFHGTFTNFFVGQGVSSLVRPYDFTGFALPFAPDWSATLGYQHTFDLSNGASIVAGAQVQYASKFWTSFSHGLTRCVNVPTSVLPQSACVDPGVLQPAYAIANLDITWNSPDGRWNVAVWARNIGNEAVRTSGGDGGMSAAGVVTTLGATTLTPPRTYGVRLGVNW